jgi:Tfp pilus assembly protein PilP
MKILFVFFICFLTKQVSFAQYHYSSEGKVDPFIPEDTKLLKATVNGKSVRPFDASQVKLLGTLMGEEPIALVQLPGESFGTMIRIGDRLGTNSGRVIAIESKQIVVRELAINLVDANKNNRKFIDVPIKFKYESQKKVNSSVSNDPVFQNLLRGNFK